MKTPSIIIFTLLLLRFVPVFAQKDFRAGYVILNSNDTVYGFIEYKGNKANARKCIFMKEFPGKFPTTEYSPESLRGFRFTNGKYYISKHLIENDKDELLFLEYLIHGKVDIFYYRDENSDEFYFIDKGDGRLLPLTIEEKDVSIEGVNYRQETKKYVGVLKYVMQDSPLVSQEAETTDLNHMSLIKIAKDYHYSVCNDQQCIIYEKELPRIRFFLGPVIGLNLNLITRSSSNSFPSYYYYFAYGSFKTTLDPAIGASFRLNLPLLNEKLSVNDELTLNRLTTRISSEYYDEAIGITSYDNINCIQYCINNSFLISYEITKGKVRPVFSIGGFFNYSFQCSYIRDHQDVLYTGVVFSPYQDNDSPFKKLIYGPAIGFGVNARLSSTLEIATQLRYSAALGLYPNLLTNIFSLTVSMPFRL